VAEDGGFPLVWIGTVTGPEVRPIASSGSALRYLDDVRVEVDGPLGSGPTGTCIREDRSVINSDFDVNPAARPWRQAALVHGFRASAAFPLHRAGQTVGALTLYAMRPGAFDFEHVKLLDALSADLSYALEAMDHERRRREAETALRESEHSLRESDQRKSEFLAVLSHELRNPLAPIRSSLYILERAVPASDQARRARAVLDRQVGHLSHLVDDLLDLTRISRNKIQLDRQVLDLNDLVRRTVEDHRTLFEKSGRHVAAIPTPECVRVKADPTRLVQVIGNLLLNAAKFTEPGGYTTVSVFADQVVGQAVLRVSDTGIGIQPDLLVRLFEPFMQADTSLDRSKGGLGLGLALVKGLVDLHGGDVRAYSEGPGKGSEFVVRLPLVAEEAVDFEASCGSTRRSGRRVLIIEDNVDAADSLREVLEFDDHEVAVAYTGPDGLAIAREFRPEVVLCDIGLPGMDGFAVARALCADDALGAPFLVALSGYAMPDDLQRAAEAGFKEHLAKPPSPERLQELLRSYPTAAGGLGLWRGVESGSGGR
jgi:two-component system CheB/CheR fusion protein